MKCIRKTILPIVMLAVVTHVLAAPQRGLPVAEGHLVAGIEGRVVYDPNAIRWAFVPNAPITDGKGKLPAEEKTTLLPCSVLDQMARLAGEQKTLDVRLWAMVTDYRGKNYLYSLYFLPLRAAVAEPTPVEPDESEEPQRRSVLPTEILQMIERNRVPDLRRLDELVVVSTDRNLIHRTGLIETLDDGVVFSPDGFGQNVDRRTYRLLPCRTLETMQRRMQRTAGRQRYVVSGVMTEFDGQKYLLLRRAVRTHTHGNFTP